MGNVYNRLTNGSRGFTVVELLVVIVILSILAALVIASYTGIQNRAKDTRRFGDISQLKKVLEIYRAYNNAYPSLGSDDVGYAMSGLSVPLAPHTATIPSDPAYPYQYVRGSAANYSYGIRMYYGGVYCKTGVSMNAGWWGVPDCPF